MIDRATLTRIDRLTTSGRTEPFLGVAERDDGTEAELVIKLSVGCDQGEVNLAREAIAACLARQLGLPIPRPCIVEIPPEIVGAATPPLLAERLLSSSPMAFGSTWVQGFSAWKTESHLDQALLPLAAATLLFDAVIQNADRRVSNPNCLVKGGAFRIIDHELAFMHKQIIFWKAPWELTGMEALSVPGAHIFFRELRGVPVDWSDVELAWSGLSDTHLQAYANTIPTEWAAAQADIDAAIELIAGARDHIDGCIAELERVLA